MRDNDTRGPWLTLRVDDELAELALLVQLAQPDPLAASSAIVGLELGLNHEVVSLST